MIVSNKDALLTITGDGDVLEHPEGVVAIGSGGAYALAAARALYPLENMTAEEIVDRAMRIAAEICIHTNDQFTTESITIPPHKPSIFDSVSTTSGAPHSGSDSSQHSSHTESHPPLQAEHKKET